MFEFVGLAKQLSNEMLQMYESSGLIMPIVFH